MAIVVVATAKEVGPTFHVLVVVATSIIRDGAVQGTNIPLTAALVST